MGGFLGNPINEGGGPDPTSVIAGVIGSIFDQAGATDLPTLFNEALGFTYFNTMAGENFLLDGIKATVGALAGAIGVLAGALGHIIGDLLHGRLSQFLQDILAILKKLHDAVAPLILWLRRLQAIQRQYQLQALKSIVNLIQRARQFLVVLKLLHVKWAQRLDSWLLTVEGKLISRVYALFAKQNEVIGWLNWALDPVAMIRSTPYFGTFARGMKAVWGAAQAIGIGKLFPQLSRGSGPRGPVVSHAQFYADSFTGGPAGDGYFGEAQRSVTALQDRMRGELGGLSS